MTTRRTLEKDRVRIPINLLPFRILAIATRRLPEPDNRVRQNPGQACIRLHGDYLNGRLIELVLPSRFRGNNAVPFFDPALPLHFVAVIDPVVKTWPAV